jgi:Amt family ammonium transporter
MISIGFINVFRVEEEIEIRGLDIKKHGEPGYPIAAQGHGWNEMSSSEEITKSYQKNKAIPEP